MTAETIREITERIDQAEPEVPRQKDAFDGCLAGAVLGLLLAVAYGGCIIVFAVLWDNTWPPSVDPVGILFILFMAGLYGGLPSALIGGITGGLLALSLRRLPKHTHPPSAMRQGFWISLAVILPLNGGFFFWLVWSHSFADFAREGWSGYAALLGVPSLIFVATGMLFARWTYRSYLPIAAQTVIETEGI